MNHPQHLGENNITEVMRKSMEANATDPRIDNPQHQESFVEITEKYNSKGFLVERYYMKNGEQVDLPIPEFMQKNPVVGFYNPKIDYVKFTKRLTPEELKQYEN